MVNSSTKMFQSTLCKIIQIMIFVYNIGNNFYSEPNKKFNYLVRFPAVWNFWPDALDVDDLVHHLKRGVVGHAVVVRHLVLVHLVEFVAGVASAGYFPQHKAVRVHVGHAERLKDGRVERVVQNFGRHVAPSAHSGVLRLVDFVFVAAKE